MVYWLRFYRCFSLTESKSVLRYSAIFWSWYRYIDLLCFICNIVRYSEALVLIFLSTKFVYVSCFIHFISSSECSMVQYSKSSYTCLTQSVFCLGNSFWARNIRCLGEGDSNIRINKAPPPLFLILLLKLRWINFSITEITFPGYVSLDDF